MATAYQVNTGPSNPAGLTPGYPATGLYGQPEQASGTNGFTNNIQPTAEQQKAIDAELKEVEKVLKGDGFSQTQVQAFLQQYQAQKYSGPNGQVNLANMFLQGAQGGSGYGYFPDMGLLNQLTGDSRKSRLAQLNMQAQNTISAIQAMGSNSWGGSGAQNMTAKRIELEKQLEAINREAARLQKPIGSGVDTSPKTMQRYDSQQGTQTSTQAGGMTTNAYAPSQQAGGQYAPGYGQQGMAQGYAQPAYGQQAPLANSGQMAPGVPNQAAQSAALAQQYQTQLDAANAANEARYGESKGELTGLRDRTMERVDNLGVTERQDIADNLARSQANTTQSAISRGLFNSTILDSLQQGNQRTADRANLELEDKLNQQRINADLQTTGALTSLIGSKVDQGPDYNQLASLSQNLGQYGNMPVEGQQQAQPSYGSPQQSLMPVQGQNPYSGMTTPAGPQGGYNDPYSATPLMPGQASTMYQQPQQGGSWGYGNVSPVSGNSSTAYQQNYANSYQNPEISRGPTSSVAPTPGVAAPNQSYSQMPNITAAMSGGNQTAIVGTGASGYAPTSGGMMDPSFQKKIQNYTMYPGV